MVMGRSILNIIRWKSLTIFSGKWIFRLNRIGSLLLFFLLLAGLSHAQEKDSLKVATKKDSIPAAKVDSMIKKEHSPRKAALRSAILPGLGQIYNKKYWKLPIVYGALGVTGYIFVDNLKTYRDLKFSYAAKYKASLPPPLNDSTDYKKIKPQYIRVEMESLRAGRDEFRRYIDYSALFFIVFWGLNVVDAVVDAHLKAFDISPDLSMKIKPTYNPIGNTKGIALVFNFR